MVDVNAPCVGCFICGDPDDHDGKPHSEATGDTTTRYDMPGPAVPVPAEESPCQ
jgi:hypothetical protein